MFLKGYVIAVLESNFRSNFQRIALQHRVNRTHILKYFKFIRIKVVHQNKSNDVEMILIDY